MTAIENAIAHVTDTFRPERKAYTHTLCMAHHVKEMTEAGRYSFSYACKSMQVTSHDAEAALMWVVGDNARLNDIYDTDIHHLNPSDYILVGWMNEQEAAKIVPLIAA